MANLADEAFQVINLHKYLALKRRCEDIQLANEKLVNRIYNVKKILKRYKKERSALTTRLDALGDSYHEAFVPAMWAEGSQEDAVEEPGVPDEETDQAVACIPGFSQSKLSSQTDFEAVASTSGPAQPVSKKGKKTKGASAYVIFCSHRKTAIQHDHLQRTGEEASRVDLTRLLSQEWATISPEQKQVYIELSEKKKHEIEASQQVLPPAVKQEVLQPIVPLETVQEIPGFITTNSFH